MVWVDSQVAKDGASGYYEDKDIFEEVKRLREAMYALHSRLDDIQDYIMHTEKTFNIMVEQFKELRDKK